MGDPATINLRHVARGLPVALRQVETVVELLDDGNTVPFITRYRKDETGGLDEEHIRQIQGRLTKQRLLAERKQTILRSIESQGKLTEKLAKQIHSAGTAKRLEDLYLPYKPKKQTLATAARERGLEPLAAEILRADAVCADLDARAAEFVSVDRGVSSAADALLGAGHILAEQFSERADLRQRLREILHRSGILVSTRIGGEPKAAAPSQARSAAKPAEPAKSGGEKPGQPEPAPETVAAADGPAPGDEAVPAGETADPPNNPKEEPPTANPGTANPGTANPGTDNPGTDNPGHGNPGTDNPGTANPGTDNPGHGNPGTANPGTANPGTDNPGHGNPGTDNPGHGNPGPESASPEAAAEQADPPGDPPAVDTASAASGPAEDAALAEQTTDGDGATEGLPDGATSGGDGGETSGPESGSVGRPAKTEDGKPASTENDAASSAPAAPASSTPSAPPAAPQQPPAKPPKRPKADKKLSKKELKKKKQEEKKNKAFSDYFDFRDEIKKIPPHRVLAINRGERARVLRVRIECDVEGMHQAVEEMCVPPDHPHADFLRGCARDALVRLILPSLEREARRELTEHAETHAVEVFARNLRNLLLQPPIRDRRVLAVDPGFKSGCKLVALDQFGNVLAHAVIFLVGKKDRRDEARRTVTELIDRFQLSVIAIGNGTACRETEDFFAEMLGGELKDRGVAYVIVNEAGASVYSTSRLGREEFPEYDATVRGAISIGRRLQDPLSELVKIDPANIGVGLYQHDVKAKHLRVSLDEVVESCVNYVGVDLNTASPALLGYVSGLNQLTARRVYEHRMANGPFKSRSQLMDVSGFGEAAFVQAAGFLKIAGGDNPLDATWIHPESYDIAGRVLGKLDRTPQDLAAKEAAASLAQQVAGLDAEPLSGELGVGTLRLKDILGQLARPGRDPREDLPAPVFKEGVLKLEDLTPGMELKGTVLNVVDFGAFVDIGMHDSGLVHVSQLADKFVRDPHDVIAVGDIVKVWVVEVDKERRRVSLTMIPPGTERSGPRRDRKAKDKPEGGRRDREGRRDKDRPRRGRPDRKSGRKGPPRGKDRHPPRREFKPKPKPVVPITEEMKEGKAPMRSFSDLAQFLQAKEEEGKKPESKPKPEATPQPEPKPDGELAAEQGPAPQTAEPDSPPDTPPEEAPSQSAPPDGNP